MGQAQTVHIYQTTVMKPKCAVMVLFIFASNSVSTTEIAAAFQTQTE